MPLREVRDNYDGLISSGVHAFRNYLLYRTPFDQPAHAAPLAAAGRRGRGREPARCARDQGRRSRSRCSAPAASRPRRSSARRSTAASCDAVTIARPLVANPDLLDLWRAGHDRPPRPCTFCNKCLFNLLEHPLGCYDERRFDSREEMLRRGLSRCSTAARSRRPDVKPLRRQRLRVHRHAIA